MNPLPVHIESLRPYESARSLRKGDEWTFMDGNESPFEESIFSGTLPPLNRYPDPTSDRLRDAIADHYGVSRENLIVTSGSDELIDLSVRAFVRPGRTIVSLTPSYGMYRVAAETADARFAAVPLRRDFSVDEDALLSALEDADLLFLCSPNNPTGTVIPAESIERIAAAFSGRIVVDEAYGEFAAAEGFSSSIEAVRRGADNIMVLRTFSKAFAAAGARLGYGIAPTETIDVLLRIKPPYNVGVLTQAVGLELWKRRGVMEKNVRILVAERDRLMQECERIGCNVFPSAANFFLFLPPSDRSKTAGFIYQSLIDNHHIVLRRFAGRPDMENLLRVSVGLPEENDTLIAALESILS